WVFGRSVCSAADRDGESLARQKLPVTILPCGFRQVHGVARPRLYDRVMVSSPPSINQPEPQVRAFFQGKVKDYPATRRVYRKPAGLQVSDIMPAIDSCFDPLYPAHIQFTEPWPGILLSRSSQRGMR